MTQRPCRSHEEATIESLARDPEYAAEYLRAVLVDGDEAGLRVAPGRDVEIRIRARELRRKENRQ